MIQPYYSEDGIVIYHGRAEDILPGLSGVSLVSADLPYNGVIDEAWDNQWPSDEAFLEWAEDLHWLFDSCTNDNATIYTFSGTRLAARMEVQIGRRFNVIGSVVWDKGAKRNAASGPGISVASLRTYWAASSWTGEDAKVAAGHSPKSGCHWFDRCQWAMPTRETYQAWQVVMPGAFLRDYDSLRRDYDSLRRTFNLTSDDQWGAVWRFKDERDRFHPCQKPLAMMHQIVRVSSRHGDLVLDPTMGSGSTLRACKDLGRRAIGIDIIEANCEIAARRLSQGVLPFGGR